MRSLLGRLGRQVVVGGAGLALLAGMAIPAAAAPRAFEATVTDGLLVIGLVPNALGGLPECIDGTDGEYLAPFTPGLDGAVDWPADPDCDNILDGDERVAGNQSAVPVTMSGVVDDVSGTISGVTVAFADSTLAIDGGPGVGPVGVKNSVSQTGSGSGSYVPATGAIDLGGSLDLTFNIEMCIPAFGCTAAAFPGGLSGTGGSAPYWTARCHVAIEPDTFSTASIGGDPWNTVADDTFPIAAPADFGAGEGGGGTVPCVVLAGSFGLPGSGALSTTIRSGAVVGLTGSYFRVGDAITVEPGAGGSSKLTFPVETWPAAAGSDLTFEIASIDVTATDDVKECSDKIDNDADTTIDYGSKVTNDTDCGSKLDDDEATPGDQLTVSRLQGARQADQDQVRQDQGRQDVRQDQRQGVRRRLPRAGRELRGKHLEPLAGEDVQGPDGCRDDRRQRRCRQHGQRRLGARRS
ncbi:MAG: hypothetical protein M5T61_05720 [Acidimicrobiia bacterium]|nr:hypothetical protein [Acidimicrobiia bacterium]